MNDAKPVAGLTVSDPIAVPLAKNVTTPVGVPAAGLAGVTVAVNVTGWPPTAGLLELVKVVVVAVETVTVSEPGMYWVTV